jgi:hypothetical protein
MRLRFPALAGGLLLLAAPLLADEAEDKAVEAVEMLGGKVERNERAAGKPVVMVDRSFTKVMGAGVAELKKALPLAAIYK